MLGLKSIQIWKEKRFSETLQTLKADVFIITVLSTSLQTGVANAKNSMLATNATTKRKTTHLRQLIQMKKIA